MRTTERYRKQHSDILDIANSIANGLDANEIAKDASGIRMQVANLIGKLQFHLTIEDKSVYPSLLNHSDARVKNTAQRFNTEMGGIMKTVEGYKNNWSNAKKVQEAPAAFIRETKTILDALVRRIEKENNELYKMIDELE